MFLNILLAQAAPTDVLDILNMLSGLPLHVLLLGAIVVLWRDRQLLQSKLEDCLSSHTQRIEALEAANAAILAVHAQIDARHDSDAS